MLDLNQELKVSYKSGNGECFITRIIAENGEDVMTDLVNDPEDPTEQIQLYELIEIEWSHIYRDNKHSSTTQYGTFTIANGKII